MARTHKTTAAREYHRWYKSLDGENPNGAEWTAHWYRGGERHGNKRDWKAKEKVMLRRADRRQNQLDARREIATLTVEVERPDYIRDAQGNIYGHPVLGPDGMDLLF